MNTKQVEQVEKIESIRGSIRENISASAKQPEVQYAPCNHEECQFDPSMLDNYMLLEDADEYITNILMEHFEEYKE